VPPSALRPVRRGKVILRSFGYLPRYPCLRIALFHLLAHTQ
jgi:hypothetical protein